ncbi:hypothetical protein Tco_0682412 [Tanacetum coccineum]|uniref:Uncharacterized protein n=1 Tax=Tanacetum coccineum TaxID=301880 RepID=A0ABQ4XR29_9ASTR
MQVIPDEEEVAINAIPLATKPPTIVDWKIHKEGKNIYYQILRADGSSKMYMVFSQMLKSFDRQDLEDLYNLGRIVGIKRLLDDLRVTAAKVRVTAANQNLVLLKLMLLVQSYNCSKIKTAKRVSTVKGWKKTEERIKIA